MIKKEAMNDVSYYSKIFEGLFFVLLVDHTR